MTPPRIDVKRLINECFGGPEALYYRMDAAGYEPPRVSGIRKWCERSRIDTDRLAELMLIYRQSHRHPLPLERFIDLGASRDAE